MHEQGRQAYTQKTSSSKNNAYIPSISLGRFRSVRNSRRPTLHTEPIHYHGQLHGSFRALYHTPRQERTTISTLTINCARLQSWSAIALSPKYIILLPPAPTRGLEFLSPCLVLPLSSNNHSLSSSNPTHSIRVNPSIHSTHRNQDSNIHSIRSSNTPAVLVRNPAR